MATYEVKNRQSFFDISIQLFGTHERGLELVAQTELESVTDIPEVGTLLEFEPVLGFNTNFYDKNDIVPASSDFNSDESGSFGGEYDVSEYGFDFDV